jgi:hypothetical protein
MAYMVLIDRKEQKDIQKLDMQLSREPKTGMLGQPNKRRGGGSVGTEGLMALMGGPMLGGRR